MKKTLFLMFALLATAGAWAALSSSTIVKSGNVTDTWNIASALPTDNWTAMQDAPAGVTALGGTPYYRTQEISISDEGALSITFSYTSGYHRLDILGVDLLNSNNEVIRSDYHTGYTGGNREHNVYMLDHIASGSYKIRFIINDASTTSSSGNITIKHINIKTANSFAEITHWYFVRMHSNQTHYMYYSGSEIGFNNSKLNQDNYLWGFVKDIDGVRIYNKAAGSSVALDNANPCTLSANGLSQTFTFSVGNAGNNGAAAGAYFSLYKITNSANSYLNYRTNNTIQRWEGDDEGSTLMIDEAPIAGGRVYKIQAYFSTYGYSNQYFTNADGTLAFNTTATNGVKDYWVLRSSGNTTYPWKFESGRGDGKFLSPETGVSTTGGYVQINNCPATTSFHLYGGNNDAAGGDIRNLGTWSPNAGKSGFARTGNGGCWGGSHNNSNWTTDYIIEEVTGVDMYTVVSNLDDGGVTYSPSYTGVAGQTNGGFYILASAPSASDFTTISVDNYTAGEIFVDASAKTITVNYTANITYTLTDVNGATYSWSASGVFGTAPTLTGCDGYTLSNEVWNEGSRTYTANITFPFPVSSNNKTNWTYIGSFAANSYTTSSFCWYVKSSDAIKVYSGKDKLPTNLSGDHEKWEWCVIPACSDGAFSFTIKNASTNKNITMAESPNAGFSNQISLTDNGTAFTFNNHRWKLPTTTTELFISQNSSSASEQEVGVYGPNGAYGVHPGNDIAFITPADFATLDANLIAACEAFIPYSNILGSGLGQYSGETSSAMSTAYATATTATPLTAAELTSLISTLENPASKLTLNMPTTNGFYRFKIGDNYMCNVANNEHVRTVTSTGNDASTIFFLSEDSYLIAYADGYGFNFGYCKPSGENATTIFNAFDFSESSTKGKYLIHSTAGTGDGTYSNRYITISGSTLDEGEGAWSISEVTSLPVTISAAGWATFSAPVALTIPDGVTAYTATESNETLTLKALEDVIPANTGVLLKGEAATYNFPITTASDFAGTNIFSNTIAAISVTANTNYVLANKNNSLGFYKLNDTTMPGFKAYIPANVLSTSSVSFIGFADDDVTAVNSAISDQILNGQYYDLQGRKVAAPQKGQLYIVNGKKVLY